MNEPNERDVAYAEGCFAPIEEEIRLTRRRLSGIIAGYREACEEIAGMSLNAPARDLNIKPWVVCICGSTRFYDAWQKAIYDETMRGNITLQVGFYHHADPLSHGQEVGCTAEQKIMLDELHKRKIDLADEILVLNVDGYVGDSTRSEIRYAREHGKMIRFLEPMTVKDIRS